MTSTAEVQAQRLNSFRTTAKVIGLSQFAEKLMITDLQLKSIIAGNEIIRDDQAKIALRALREIQNI